MTAQLPEKLILEGAEVLMTSLPDIPVDHPRIDSIPREEVDPHDPDEVMVFSTACWRNYVGTWELRAGKLYLVKIAGIFRLKLGGPLFANWVSQPLVVPRGNLLHYVHMGFESIFEEELIIHVHKGVETSRQVVDNRQRLPFDPSGQEASSWEYYT